MRFGRARPCSTPAADGRRGSASTATDRAARRRRRRRARGAREPERRRVCPRVYRRVGCRSTTRASTSSTRTSSSSTSTHPAGAFADWRGLLRPDGRVVIVTSNRASPVMGLGDALPNRVASGSSAAAPARRSRTSIRRATSPTRRPRWREATEAGGFEPVAVELRRRRCTGTRPSPGRSRRRSGGGADAARGRRSTIVALYRARTFGSCSAAGAPGPRLRSAGVRCAPLPAPHPRRALVVATVALLATDATRPRPSSGLVSRTRDVQFTPRAGRDQRPRRPATRRPDDARAVLSNETILGRET